MAAPTQRERVFKQLRKAILDGKLEPGQPIAERALGELAKASRIPVREALIQLQNRGLVTLIGGRGAFVRTFTLDEVRQLYEVREALEGTAARAAAGHIDPSELDRFESAFEGFLGRANGGSSEGVRRVSTAFHEAIICECQNPLLERVVADIRSQIHLSRKLSYRYASHTQILRGVKEHLAILRALRAGNGALAEQRMRAHIAAWRALRIHIGDGA